MSRRSKLYGMYEDEGEFETIMSKITVTKTYVEDYNKCKWLINGVCTNYRDSLRYNYRENSEKECIEGNYKCFEKEDGICEQSR